ncbi:MAG: glycosyltransferase family 2 protein [Halobacteriota archaeon]
MNNNVGSSVDVTQRQTDNRGTVQRASYKTPPYVTNWQEVSVVKVSAIIPTYNRAHLVGRSIESALNQTHLNLEILVVDDGSTDETFDSVMPFLQHPHVQYFRHEKRRGHQAARNTGIKNASGEYIAFLDSDDTWIPKKIELQLAAMAERGPRCVALTAMWWITDDPSKKTKYLKKYEGHVYPQMLAEPGPNFCCMLVPAECLKEIGFLDESTLALADWDTCISLSRLYEFTTVDEPCTIYYGNQPDSISKNALVKALGWKHIVEKNQSDMLRFVGRRGLARHLRIIAFLFDAGGDFARCKEYMLKAFRTNDKNPAMFLLALSTLFGERVFHFVKRAAAPFYERLLVTPSGI